MAIGFVFYRWARKGKIPYLNAVSLLPEDFKFNLQDSRLFGLVSTVKGVLSWKIRDQTCIGKADVNRFR